MMKALLAAALAPVNVSSIIDGGEKKEERDSNDEQ
jgi:hypothetical protein